MNYSRHFFKRWLSYSKKGDYKFVNYGFKSFNETAYNPINLLKIVSETFDWLLLTVESILWKCVVKTRITFLSRQTFLINQKHISTFSYTRNTTRKTTNEKTDPPLPLSLFYPLYSKWMSNNKGEKSKEWKWLCFFLKIFISVHNYHIKIPLFVTKRYFENKIW